MRVNSDTAVNGTLCCLIPYCVNHVEMYHTWMQDPDLLHLTGSEPLSLEEELEMQRTWANDDDKLTFLIVDRERKHKSECRGVPVGDVNCFLNDVDDKHTAEIEVMVADSKSRRKGIAREALTLMMSYCVRYVDVKHFVAKIKDGNEASVQLFTGLGFQFVKHVEVFGETTFSCSDFTAVDPVTSCYNLQQDFTAAVLRPSSPGWQKVGAAALCAQEWPHTPFQTRLSQFDDREEHCCSIALIDGVAKTVCGYAAVYASSTEGDAVAESVVVASSVRGRGLGRMLMTKVLQDARERGYAGISVHCSADVAPFYNKVGFQALADVHAPTVFRSGLKDAMQNLERQLNGSSLAPVNEDNSVWLHIRL